MGTLRILQAQRCMIIRHVCTVIMLMCVAGCLSVKLISDYDEETDKSVTQLHKKVETYFENLQSSLTKGEGAYNNDYEKVYTDIRVEISAIRMRVAARSKNEIQLQQVDLLSENWDKLEKLHKLGLTTGSIAPLHTAFTVGFTAILKLEMAKKKGE